MKCEICKNNEATYHYRTNINGKVTEKHLCSECAAKAELGNEFGRDFDGFFDDMFNFEPMFGRSFFEPFTPFGGSLLERVFPRVELLIDERKPQADEPEDASEPAAEQEKTAEPEAKQDNAFARRREINALRHQMHEAVRREDFEKAAELRDKLHGLEKE